MASSNSFAASGQGRASGRDDALARENESLKKQLNESKRQVRVLQGQVTQANTALQSAQQQVAELQASLSAEQQAQTHAEREAALLSMTDAATFTTCKLAHLNMTILNNPDPMYYGLPQNNNPPISQTALFFDHHLYVEYGSAEWPATTDLNNRKVFGTFPVNNAVLISGNPIRGMGSLPQEDNWNNPSSIALYDPVTHNATTFRKASDTELAQYSETYRNDASQIEAPFSSNDDPRFTKVLCYDARPTTSSP